MLVMNSEKLMLLQGDSISIKFYYTDVLKLKLAFMDHISGKREDVIRCENIRITRHNVRCLIDV